MTHNTADTPASERLCGWGIILLLFFSFLAINLGLGYAGVKRFDARTVRPDVRRYFRMTLDGCRAADAPYCFRVAVPTMASGVLYAVSRAHVLPTESEQVFLSLLIVNATLTAMTAVLAMLIAWEITRQSEVAVLTPFIYLSAFVVVNVYLIGMVDSAEALVIAALLFALLKGRWLAAPILIGLGALAKETIVPFGVSGIAIWWMYCAIERREFFVRGALAVALSALVGTAVIGSVRAIVGIEAFATHTFAWTRIEQFFPHLLDVVFARAHVYAFVFLGPMAVPRLRRIPGPMLAASAGMALAVVCLGAYANIGGNAMRPLFSTVGVVLTVSCAMFLRDLVRPSALHTGHVETGDSAKGEPDRK